jgi:hypothetical protein
MSYRSSASFLGLPLVHVATGSLDGQRYRRGVARGWIAVGDVAFGVLFAAGGVSVGGIAVGGAALGGLTIGGLAVGLFAIGGGALGLLAVGGAAFAWHAALGGLAVARNFAIGGAAFAEHANDPAASQMLETSTLLSSADALMSHSQWLVLLAVLPALLAFIRRRRGRQPGEPISRL